MATVLYVNGRQVRTRAPAGTTLLDLLRDELDLTSAKPGCRTGDCGACSVLIGVRLPDQPDVVHELHDSCLTTVAMVEGCHVITADGLCPPADAQGSTLGPVHRALLDAGAVQCGYCAPGLVVALTWGLLAGGDPLGGVAGNLCRCTGYAGIRRACELLSEAAPLSPDDLLPGVIREASARLEPCPAEQLDVVGSRWLGGGTDDIPDRRHTAPAHRRQLLLRRVPRLGLVSERAGGGVEVGAAVTVAQLLGSEAVTSRWPDLSDHLLLFGSPAVRSSATVGGNLVHASPAADLAVPLLAMGACVVLSSAEGRREVALDRFFVAHRRVDLRPGEVLESVRIPEPVAGTRLRCERVARRRIDDVASVSLAAVLGADPSGRLTYARLAAGGVAPIPLLLTGTADALRGALPDPIAVERPLAAMDAEIAPIDDVHGAAQYKRELLGNLLVSVLAGGDPERVAPLLRRAPGGRREVGR